MKIPKNKIRSIIREEIEVLSITNKGQFAYLMQLIMDKPSEAVSADVVEPIRGKMILRKGQSFSDITPEGSYYLLKHYNIDVKNTPSIGRTSRLTSPSSTRTEPSRARSSTYSPGLDDVESVASSLMGHVRGGSSPLRSSIEKISADPSRNEIAVYLRDPKTRGTTDQEIACAIRYLLDNKVMPTSRYIINPCGYKDKATKDLMMIVKL